MNFKELFTGSLSLEITGPSAEREVAYAVKHGVRVKRLKRLGDSCVHAQISGFEYRKFKRCLQTSSIRVLGRKGTANAVKKLDLRIGAVIIAGLCLLLWGISGLFVLNIDISGNETVSRFELMEALSKNGINVPALKSAVDKHAVEDILDSEFAQIDLINAYFKGSRLCIEIIEGSPVPNIEESAVSDIIAEYGGVIEKMTVESGMPCVKEFQRVEKGDILVRGNYIKKEKSFSVHSRASITARVDITKTAKLDEDKSISLRTGSETLLKYLKIGGIWVKIDGDNPFKEYSCRSELIAICGENLPMSFELYDVYCYETEEIPFGEAITAAEIDARERAYYLALDELPDDAEVISLNTNTFVDPQGGKNVAVTLTALIDICTQAEAMPLPQEDTIGERSS